MRGVRLKRFLKVRRQSVKKLSHEIQNPERDFIREERGRIGVGSKGVCWGSSGSNSQKPGGGMTWWGASKPEW
jgi:hypothetical protein